MESPKPTETERTCTICKKTKPIDCFYRIRKGKDWRFKFCSTCHMEKGKAHKPTKEQNRERGRRKRAKEAARMAIDPEYREYILAQHKRHRDKAEDKRRAQNAAKKAAGEPIVSREKRTKEEQLAQSRAARAKRRARMEADPEYREMILAREKRYRDKHRGVIPMEQRPPKPEKEPKIEYPKAPKPIKPEKEKKKPLCYGKPLRVKKDFIEKKKKSLILTDPKPDRPIKFLPCTYGPEEELQEEHIRMSRIHKRTTGPIHAGRAPLA